MLDVVKRVSVYQPQQVGLKFPEIPVFANHAEERQLRKQRLVAACRAFAQQGFDYGFAGHLTVRDPERPELYWTNPMAVHFSLVKVSNLILVDHDGMVVEGDYAVNRAGFVLHAAVHEAHPDIVAMCHAHTVYGTAFAALGKGDVKKYHGLMAPTVPLSRLIFRTPTQFYKTGIVFMAWLNGHQDHFIMVNGAQAMRPLPYFIEVFKLADQAQLLRDPELAVRRMKQMLAVYGA